MADDSGAKKTNPVIENHWEKIVLAIVAVVAVVLIGTQVSGSGSKAVRGLDSAKADFKKRKDSPGQGIDAPKNDPAPSVSSPQLPESAGPFTVGTKTKFSFEFRKVEEKVAQFWLPKVTMNAPVPTFEGVKLSWALSGEPPAEDKKIIVVKPATYIFKLEKMGPGDTKWKEIPGAGELGAETLQYLDTRTSPKQEYKYRVTLGAKDPPYVAKNPERFSKESQHTSAPGPVQTLGIWNFEFSNYNPGDPDHEVDGVPAPIPPQVWVKITKFDADAGKVEWSRIHKQGAELGIAEEDGKKNSTHLVFSAKKGRMVPVDFKSGGKVDRIEIDKMVEYEYKVCDPIVDGGVLVCKGPETKKGFVRVNRVFYTDEEGKKKEEVSDAGPGRRPDSLCPDHGGEVKVAPPAPPDDDKKKSGGKEEDAAKLLDDAEELWQSTKQSDKKKAVEAYKKLIKEFADTDAVKKHLERIKQRSQKKFD